MAPLSNILKTRYILEYQRKEILSNEDRADCTAAILRDAWNPEESKWYPCCCRN